jgi:hypothetical protein
MIDVETLSRVKKEIEDSVVIVRGQRSFEDPSGKKVRREYRRSE